MSRSGLDTHILSAARLPTSTRPLSTVPPSTVKSQFAGAAACSSSHMGGSATEVGRLSTFGYMRPLPEATVYGAGRGAIPQLLATPTHTRGRPPRRDRQQAGPVHPTRHPNQTEAPIPPSGNPPDQAKQQAQGDTTEVMCLFDDLVGSTDERGWRLPGGDGTREGQSRRSVELDPRPARLPIACRGACGRGDER